MAIMLVPRRGPGFDSCAGRNIYMAHLHIISLTSLGGICGYLDRDYGVSDK